MEKSRNNGGYEEGYGGRTRYAAIDLLGCLALGEDVGYDRNRCAMWFPVRHSVYILYIHILRTIPKKYLEKIKIPIYYIYGPRCYMEGTTTM